MKTLPEGVQGFQRVIAKLFGRACRREILRLICKNNHQKVYAAYLSLLFRVGAGGCFSQRSGPPAVPFVRKKVVHMDVTWQMFLIVCPLAFLAGFVDSVAGGGGLISLPAYYLAGLPPVLAAGTNKLSACLGTVAASGRFILGKKVDWWVAALAVPGALLGSWLGTTLLQSIPENAIRMMMIAAIPLVALVVLRKRDGLQASRVLSKGTARMVSLLIGLMVGFYDGLVGPGTGTFLILLFTMLLGMEAVRASGTAKLVNLASNVASLVTLLTAGQVLIGLGLPAAACAIAGNLLGAGMTIRKGTGFIRGMLMTVLALLLAKMVLDVL